MTPAPPPTPTRPGPPSTARARVLGFVLGLALLAAAVWVVARDGRTLEQALHAARHADPRIVIALAALPVLNWALSSLIFWVLTRRFAPVPLGEMAALTAVASSLNALPLRPGLLGRIVYLKRLHGVKVWDSARVTLEAIGLTVIVALATLLGSALGGIRGVLLALGLLVIIGSAAWTAWAGRSAGAGPRPGRPIDAGVLVALGVRAVEMVVWTARYMLVFALIARPIGLEAAILLAASAQIVSLLPIAIGLREWTVAMLSVSTPIGLTADLLHRAVELAVGVPLGLLGWWALWRGRSRVRKPGTLGVQPSD